MGVSSTTFAWLRAEEMGALNGREQLAVSPPHRGLVHPAEPERHEPFCRATRQRPGELELIAKHDCFKSYFYLTVDWTCTKNSFRFTLFLHAIDFMKPTQLASKKSQCSQAFCSGCHHQPSSIPKHHHSHPWRFTGIFDTSKLETLHSISLCSTQRLPRVKLLYHRAFRLLWCPSLGYRWRNCSEPTTYGFGKFIQELHSFAYLRTWIPDRNDCFWTNSTWRIEWTWENNLKCCHLEWILLQNDNENRHRLSSHQHFTECQSSTPRAWANELHLSRALSMKQKQNLFFGNKCDKWWMMNDKCWMTWMMNEMNDKWSMMNDADDDGDGDRDYDVDDVVVSQDPYSTAILIQSQFSGADTKASEQSRSFPWVSAHSWVASFVFVR